MATVPASVGVTIPIRIPPMIKIGKHSGRIACLTADFTSSGSCFSLVAGW